MQTCPKCGTVLDDSKKTCYMCGTVLKAPTNNKKTFGESLSKELLENDSKSEVFYSKVEEKEEKKEERKTKVFFNSMDTSVNDGDGIASLNGHTKAKKNKEEHSSKTEKKDKTKGSFLDNLISKKDKPKEKKVEEKKEKNFIPSDNQNKFINFDEHKEEKVTKKNDSGNKKFPFALIFNVICIILFVGLVIFAYQKFLKPKLIGVEKLGNLQYKISSDFEEVNRDSSSIHYNYGNSCTIKINYGKSSNADTFVDNYLSNQKLEFEKEPNTKPVREKIKINDNTWESLSVVYFKADNENEKVSGFEKYKYVSIFKDGEYYNTIYVNANNDEKCASMYEDFRNSLILK